MTDEQPPDVPQVTPASEDAWAKVRAAFHPRATGGQLVMGLLFAALGFALVVQVRSAQGADALASARPDDLVRILDDLQERQARLQAEANRLTATRDELVGGADQAGAALERAKSQAETLGILAGSLPATGPGITVTMLDRDGRIDAPLLLDAVQELRDAGAEAIQIDGQRVVASTALVDTPRGIEVDGVFIEPPYELVVIGDPETLASALAIPGGVTESLRNIGADAIVEQRKTVDVTALKPLPQPEYARPTSD